MRIKHIDARAIQDSRGKPTVETILYTSESEAVASVPSGKSMGTYEAKELRDSDGGVETACSNVTGEIAQAITARDFSSLSELDTFLVTLDGTSDKSRLGANAILSVSIAAARLFAMEAGVPLWRFLANEYDLAPHAPRFFVNMINGGAHADFRLPFQEHILVVGEQTVAESVQTAERAFAELGEAIRSEEPDVPIGDEGGYSPTFTELERPFELLSAVSAAYKNTTVAIDAAANELTDDSGGYTLLGKHYTSDELRALYGTLVEKFPLSIIEDPFSETDSKSFAAMTAQMGQKIIIIGDDLIATNPMRINEAIEQQSINAVLIKPNQIGSISEAVDAVRKTLSAGWNTVCSHRSGETNDTFIADFAYAIGAYGIKAGGLAQQIRREKYQRLQEIEQEAQAL